MEANRTENIFKEQNQMKWKREHEIGILSMRDNEKNFLGIFIKN